MNRHSAGKWIEIYWPWAAALGAAVIAARFHNRVILAPDVKARILDKLVDFCSIGVGFWSTALALLLALEGRDTVVGLKKLDIYGRIVGYFLSSVYAFFALLVGCLVTIAVGRPNWIGHRTFMALWGFLLVFMASSMLRSFNLLGKLLRSR